MNARTKPTPQSYTAIARSMIHKTCDATDFLGADRADAIRALAHSAPSGLDIGDEREVMLFIHRMGRRPNEAIELAEDVANAVREMRQSAVMI